MVEPAYEYEDGELYCGEVLKVLADMPDESVQCIVTSPPYFGLRDYGTGKWVGGDENCSHKRDSKRSDLTLTGHKAMNNKGHAVGDAIYKTECPRCGAVRKDNQIGLEETPEEYIQRLVEVFRELRRVLATDGIAWLNLGDSYWGGKGRSGAGSAKTHRERTSDTLQGEHTYLGKEGGFRPTDRGHEVFKQKDLCMMPHRVAIALQEDGWWVRQDIVWHKNNPMPESVRDRCTKAHEYIFMLTKSKKYYYDHMAVKEDSQDSQKGKGVKRNRRSVWKVPVFAYKGAHFATYPPKLIEPCILAGTSEKGHCSKCGKRWKRETKKSKGKVNQRERGDKALDYEGSPMNRNGSRNSGLFFQDYPSQTIGWVLDCDCDVKTQKDTVLDPFMGSGTTAIVARQHGRRFIGIDLNAEYLELADNRISFSE